MDKIVILDFGGQTTQLIARRIREFGVYSEIVQGSGKINFKTENLKGVIFSGSPYSVYDPDAPKPDDSVFDLGVPILGICYGLQLLTLKYGGSVLNMEQKEFGRAPVFFKEECGLFPDVEDGFNSLMSHGDSVLNPGQGFTIAASSEKHPAALVNRELNFYGIQFHPEVSHCEFGNKILENFVTGICKAEKNWDMDSYLNLETEIIKKRIQGRDILVLISGGVDSTVTAALLLKALPPERIFLMYIDTGLMRKNETSEVEKILRNLGAENIRLVDASNRFLEALKGVEDPEEKREIIGDLFITIQEEFLPNKIGKDYFLAQGTLYTDMIESGKGVGKKAQVIKSHHNVRSPLVEKKREAGLIIEPLSMLFKDEVRKLGLVLGLDEEVVYRHPFPGPGLGVRILGEVTEEKCRILKDADYLFIDQLKKRGLYRDIWQAFCVLLPIKSVGVTGDARHYGYVLALRAINSMDGMTADVYPFRTEDLLEISSLLTNTIPEIGRVVYDISSKPPATIEWE